MTISSLPYRKQEWLCKYLVPNDTRYTSTYLLRSFRSLHTSKYKSPDELIERLILSMDYNKEFLSTLYWKCISYGLRHLYRWTCVDCKRYDVPLVVHHITYERHGKEHIFFMEDLCVLCKECHLKRHQK